MGSVLKIKPGWTVGAGLEARLFAIVGHIERADAVLLHAHAEIVEAA